MSGPIIRKYGFPNFDEIFGKREPQHGVEDRPAVDKPDTKIVDPTSKMTDVKVDDSKSKAP